MLWWAFSGLLHPLELLGLCQYVFCLVLHRWVEAAPQHLAPICRDGVLGSGGSIAPLASGGCWARVGAEAPVALDGV
jgi:hypothetical protein